MNKEKIKKFFEKTHLIILGAAIGLGLNLSKNPNEIKPQFQNQTTISNTLNLNEQNQIYKQVFEKRLKDHSLLKQDFQKSQQEIQYTFQDISQIKKIIWPIIETSKTQKLSKTQIKILQEYIKTFNVNSKNLQWYQTSTINLLKIHSNLSNISELRIYAQKFINSNSNQINSNLLFNHVPIKKKTAIKAGKYINFTEINENLSANIYKYCKEYKVNIKLVHFLILIENNFGDLTTSNKGAKGVSQTMPENVKKFFGNDKSNWAHFLTTFKLLKEHEKLLNINISNPNSITDIDFLIAAISYFDGTSNLIRNPKDTFEKKDIGYTYLLKALTALKLVKFQIPTKIQLKSNSKTYFITTSTIN